MDQDQLLRVLVRVGKILRTREDERLEDAAGRIVRERDRLRRELDAAHVRIKELRADLFGIGDADDARRALIACREKNEVLRAEITNLHKAVRKAKAER